MPSDDGDAVDAPADRPFPVSDALRPRRTGAAREFPLGEHELLVMIEGRQVVHTLNATAWAVWDLCDGARTVGDIVSELAGVVGRPPAEIAVDVRETVRRLGALALLEVA